MTNGHFSGGAKAGEMHIDQWSFLDYTGYTKMTNGHFIKKRRENTENFKKRGVQVGWNV